MNFLKTVLLTAVLTGFGFAQNSVELPLPKVIFDSLPWFAVREVGNSNVPFTKTHLLQLTQKNDRVALVYFATWCVPCREGVKRLANSQSQLSNKKINVVLVNIGENDEKLIQQWVNKLGASNFKVISDPFRRMTENFGIIRDGEEMSLPKTLLLGSQAKPVKLIGQEGKDWPQILWEK